MSTKKRKTNYRPLIIAGAALLFTFVAIWFLTKPSKQSLAVRELQSSFNITDIKKVWDTYRTDLASDKVFVDAVRTKIQSINPSIEQLNEAKTWLPQPPTYFNIIVVPDLSRRLTEESYDFDQVKNDTILINHVWKVFRDSTWTKMNTKDRFMIDVTDNNQGGGAFRNIANRLFFDLGTYKNKGNRLFFDDNGKSFVKDVKDLYGSALKEPLGADYWLYFNRYLVNKIQPNTLRENYKNVVVILTDGYLETENALYTGGEGQMNAACNARPVDDFMEQRGMRIPSIEQKYENVTVLMLEIAERPNGQGCHYEVLKNYWASWFNEMGIKSANGDFFVIRENSTNLTKSKISNFFANLK